MEDEEAANELKTNNSNNTILRLPCKEQHLLQTLPSSPISNFCNFPIWLRFVLFHNAW